jgi:hypothetical protein
LSLTILELKALLLKLLDPEQKSWAKEAQKKFFEDGSLLNLSEYYRN